MFFRGIIMLLASLIGLAAFGASTASALPPRPTPMPTATAPSGPSSPAGGAIRLRVEGAPADVWTMVEWQDAVGGWHVVEGWQGTLEADRTKTWWVAAADLGRGPFRWIVLSADRRKVLTASALFQLPGRPREVVRVELNVAP
jgi:hypothetical protein